MHVYTGMYVCMFLRTDTISILNSKVECNLKLVPCPNDVERPNENNLCARREHKKKKRHPLSQQETQRERVRGGWESVSMAQSTHTHYALYRYQNTAVRTTTQPSCVSRCVCICDYTRFICLRTVWFNSNTYIKWICLCADVVGSCALTIIYVLNVFSLLDFWFTGIITLYIHEYPCNHRPM